MIADDAMSNALQRVLDQQEIRDVLARYARGVDRRNWELVRSAFHPDANDDHGAYHGGVEGLIEWIASRHASIDQAMHLLGNCLVEFVTPAVAIVETYYVALFRLDSTSQEARNLWFGDAAPSGVVDASVLGRYIDRFEKRDGIWRIADRVNIYETMRAAPASTTLSAANHHWARRDEFDRIFRARSTVLQHVQPL